MIRFFLLNIYFCKVESGSAQNECRTEMKTWHRVAVVMRPMIIVAHLPCAQLGVPINQSADLSLLRVYKYMERGGGTRESKANSPVHID